MALRHPQLQQRQQRQQWRRQRLGAAAAVAPAVGASDSPAEAAASGRRLPEDKARHVRPPGWTAPGPPPAGPQGDPELQPQPGESLSYLAGDWRLFQLDNGHRWSLDDHLTAVVALQEAARLQAEGGRPVEHALDLGCGIGSVLLLLAWGLPPTARLVGVEAQAVSVALARRSVRYNLGAAGAARAVVVHADLRDSLPPGLLPPAGGWQLVTGTPPYVELGGGGASGRPQKTPCNLETRGGVEEYVAAAARNLAPGGVFVVCMGIQGQKRKDRVQAAAAEHGFVVARRVEVIPRAGKPPLFEVCVLRREQDGAQPAAGSEAFLVRLADGSIGPDMLAARAAIGMPPPPPPPRQQQQQQQQQQHQAPSRPPTL